MTLRQKRHRRYLMLTMCGARRLMQLMVEL
jgi:hypothetical protein